MNAGPMSFGWYYSKRGAPPGQQYGPFTWEQLVSYAQSGAVSSDDLVWNQQMGDWRRASEIPGLIPSYAAAPAYGAGPGYGAAGYGPPPVGQRRSPWPWLAPLIAVVVVGLGLGLYFGIWYHKGNGAFAQQEGEIFLEPNGTAGPDSFAGEQFVSAGGPATSLSIPNPKVTLPPAPSTTKRATTTTQAASTTTKPGAATTTTAEPVVLASYPGDTPALYGGSKSTQIADKEGELRFLEQNPLKAQAFCEALNSDPTLRWSGGNKVYPDQLRAYFAELTPMLLTRDIRVTNYGYRNGHPTPRQSVLQAGQLVLVDRYGVPRKRAQCGNPLTPPRPSSRPPRYTGPRWPGFSPTTVIVVQQTTVIINNFTTIDIHTGQTFGRPAGTDGGSDGPPPASGSSGGTTTTAPPSTETTATTAPPSTETTGGSTTSSTEGSTTTTGSTGGPIDSGELNGAWIGTMTITDLTLDQQASTSASDQGCSTAALQALKGQPLPMTMQITMDPGGKSGKAITQIDASSLGGSGGAAGSPQTFTFTYDNNTLTFDTGAGSSAGQTSSMTATVSPSDQVFKIVGTLSSAGSGVTMKADWQVTRQP